MRLEQAVDLATRFHAGQVDKAGNPYIEHVLRVMDAVDTDREKLVAVMHDLLEDTPLTASDLQCAGCPPQIVDGVEAMTKRDGEDYEDFIRRAAVHPIARAVKAADLADNADETRLAVLEPDMAARLRVKYASAQALLQSLVPMDPADRARARSAETGIPVGAGTVGVPDGEPEAWATFWCSQPDCSRPAGTIELTPAAKVNGSGGRDHVLVVWTFLGTSSRGVNHERLSDVRGALADTEALYTIDSELAPWWCPRCERIYCGSHWRQRTRFDDWFYDCTDGTCPQGHTRTLWD